MSGFFLFSDGEGYKIKHRAYITTLIGNGGFFMLFNKSKSFFSKTLRASYAARSAGIASARSFSQSSLIELASSTATDTTASSLYITSAILSASAFYTSTSCLFISVSSAAYLS